MRIVFTAVNASYVHCDLAARQLVAYTRQSVREARNRGDIGSDASIELLNREYTINETIDEIARDLSSLKADIYLFSAYIWNIREIRDIAEIIGKAQPTALIGLGGPEVSFDPEEQLRLLPEADFIIQGEGEIACAKLVAVHYTRLWKQQQSSRIVDQLATVVHEIPNFVCRHPAGGYLYGQHAAPLNMDDLPFPYGDEYPDVENRIVYYESSRGCPFNCSYCLSSAEDGVRAKSIDKVKKELDWFWEHPIRQVKFVDRTFNYDRKRAADIWQYLIDKANAQLEAIESGAADPDQHVYRAQPTVRRITGEKESPFTNFHFELAADILNDELINLLNRAPEGLIQLEIGVQSTDPKVLEAIDRKQSIDQLSAIVKRLREPGNIHIHLDLIAGLPGEDLATFRQSFNDVIALRPHALQLGFLKLLKGTKIRRDADRGAALYRSFAPYEVISTTAISFDEIALLKDIEWLVDRLYNTGDYERSMEALMAAHVDAFAAFEDLAHFMRHSDAYMRRISKDELTVLLDRYFSLRTGIDARVGRNSLYADYMSKSFNNEHDWQRIQDRFHGPDAKAENLE